jgi:tetraacyldisaccharide 4'-kinase
MMPFLKVLLWPFTILYNLVTRIRNYLFDIGQKPSFKFDSIVISVGNLNVGGSGKTPMVEYLVRLLRQQYSVAILSRGFGRKTQGFRIASDEDTATTLGDEPYQYYLKFGKEVSVCVGEERALAIPTILNERPTTQIILLDDAFQHRTVVPQFSILLTEFSRPFYSDFVLPFGRLREARTGAGRSDAIIVTKCSPLLNRDEVEKQIRKYARQQPIYFSSIFYKEAVPFSGGQSVGKRVVLVSGIANSSALESFVAEHFQLQRHFKFNDHHFYSSADLRKIQTGADHLGADSIITTEKDMVKLISPQLQADLIRTKWFYLPVETSFFDRGADFDKLVLSMVGENLKLLHDQNP